jgi:hypothetical protein
MVADIDIVPRKWPDTAYTLERSIVHQEKLCLD